MLLDEMANIATHEILKRWQPLRRADKMIIPHKLIDVLERDATELAESNDETGEQEYAVDSDTDSSFDEE